MKNKTTRDLKKEVGKDWINVYKFGIARPGKKGWTEKEYNEIIKLIREVNATPKFCIGADPEFEVAEIDVSNNADVVNAARYFRGGTSSRLGTDGYSALGEMRPEPGSPEKVFLSIRKLIKQARKTLPNGFELLGGSGTCYPIGGHIHFGHGTSQSTHEPSPNLLAALNNFIFHPLSRASNTSVRNRSNYGRAGSWREQFHGWEYRSPCSWISHPKITKGVLSIVFVLNNLSERDLRILNDADEATERSSLFSLMGVRRRDAEEFYIFLDSLREEGKTIEQIQTFKAWGIKKKTPTSTQRSARRVPTYPVGIIEGDRFLSDWECLLRSHDPLTLCGASESRTEGLVVFFPPPVGQFFASPYIVNEVSFQHWDRPMIGLSHRLRVLAHTNIEFRNSMIREIQRILNESTVNV